jgi:hypothetical protein
MSMGLLTRKALTFGLKGILSFLLSLIFQNKEVFYPLEIRVKTVPLILAIIVSLSRGLK